MYAFLFIIYNNNKKETTINNNNKEKTCTLDNVYFSLYDLQ